MRVWTFLTSQAAHMLLLLGVGISWPIWRIVRRRKNVEGKVASIHSRYTETDGSSYFVEWAQELKKVLVRKTRVPRYNLLISSLNATKQISSRAPSLEPPVVGGIATECPRLLSMGILICVAWAVRWEKSRISWKRCCVGRLEEAICRLRIWWSGVITLVQVAKTIIWPAVVFFWGFY